MAVDLRIVSVLIYVCSLFNRIERQWRNSLHRRHTSQLVLNMLFRDVIIRRLVSLGDWLWQQHSPVKTDCDDI